MKKVILLFSTLVIFLLVPTIVLAGNPPDQSHSSYPNFSSTYPADGSTTVSISIVLHDSSGNPVVGDTVQLSTTDGTANFPTNNVITDSNGTANFTMTSTTAGTDPITVNDTTTSTTFSNWFNISFYAAATPTPSNSCSNVPSAPVLTSVISKSNNTATLTWVDSADPVSNYLVSYGSTSGKYIYGDPNIGGQGTTTFTVGSLSGNKTYYFVVAATNNCGISSFSSEVSVIVNPVPSTPVPTIGPTTPPDVPAVVVDTPTDAPTDTPVPTQAPSTDTNSTFRNLGIGIVVAGVLLVVSVIVFQIISKKKNNIPPMHRDNIFQQPKQPVPPEINNPPTSNTF